VARELTKLFEEIRRGTLQELAAYYEANAPRGEVTVVVAGRSADEAPAPDARAAHADAAEAPALIAALRAEGRTPGGIAKELALRLGIPRQDAYRLLDR
jgi:16S rRNA (cytidine1402-2'-O)-methyltransferase